MLVKIQNWFCWKFKIGWRVAYRHVRAIAFDGEMSVEECWIAKSGETRVLYHYVPLKK